MSQTPTVVQLALSSNVAYDPDRRLMVLGLFSVVGAEKLPWRFRQSVFLSAAVKNLPPGPHNFRIEALPHSEIEADPIDVETPLHGDALIVLPITSWTITKYGETGFNLVVDGQPLHKVTISCYSSQSNNLGSEGEL